MSFPRALKSPPFDGLIWLICQKELKLKGCKLDHVKNNEATGGLPGQPFACPQWTEKVKGLNVRQFLPVKAKSQAASVIASNHAATLGRRQYSTISELCGMTPIPQKVSDAPSEILPDYARRLRGCYAVTDAELDKSVRDFVCQFAGSTVSAMTVFRAMSRRYPNVAYDDVIASIATCSAASSAPLGSLPNLKLP